MAWNDAPTDRQLAWIEDIEDYSAQIPKFSGSTRKDAADYIDRYGKLVRDLKEIEFESAHGDWGDRGE